MNKLLSTRLGIALAIIFVTTLATIAGAWGFEIIGGFQPCPLCLTQRWSYYIAVPLAAILIAMVLSGKVSSKVLRTGVGAVALVMLVGGVLGAYHAGVEWGFWPGPSTCTGGGGLSGGLPDLTQKIVQCDEVQIRIFGLSFAGWNAVISGFCALVGFRAVGSHKG